MSYEIVRNAPEIPLMPGEHLKCEERKAMEQLDVGDAFLVDEFKASRRAVWARGALKPKRFSVRKQTDGSGWQVRRVE